MNILLIAPNYSNKPNTEYFPIGMAAIAAYLKAQGHQVTGLNLNHNHSRHTPQKIIAALDDCQADIVGIGGLTVAFNAIESLIETIRSINSDLPIILGGGITSAEGQLVVETLKPNFSVVGEGERVICQLLDALENKSPLSQVRGIWHWNAGRPEFTGDGEAPADLDELPFPDLDCFNIKTHLDLQQAAGNFSPHLIRFDPAQTIPISASRSCPFQCTFCHHAGMQAYKQQTIARTISQIRHYITRYGVTSFFLYDELFSASKSRVMEFCELLKKHRINIHWFCQLRVDQLDLEMLTAMKATGCQYISFGIESGSNTILKSMRKKTSTEMIQRAVALVRQAKIGIQGNFLFGDPKETPQTIKESLNFQNKNELFFCDWSMVIPYAGTQLYDHAHKKKLITDRLSFIRNMCNTGHYLYKHQINMTRMTDDQYKTWYIRLREITDQNHRKRLARFISGEKINSWESRIEIQCPKCSHKKNFFITYPFEQTNKGPSLTGAIGVQGINILCEVCKRKMHLKARDIPHMKKFYDRFQNAVNRVISEKKSVVVIPALDRFAGSFLEDINIPAPAIESVYDTRPFREDELFLGHSTKLLQKTSSKAFEGRTILILPWTEFDKILEMIRRHKIRPKEVICWNLLFANERNWLGRTHTKRFPGN